MNKRSRVDSSQGRSRYPTWTTDSVGRKKYYPFSCTKRKITQFARIIYVEGYVLIIGFIA